MGESLEGIEGFIVHSLNNKGKVSFPFFSPWVGASVLCCVGTCMYNLTEMHFLFFFLLHPLLILLITHSVWLSINRTWSNDPAKSTNIHLRHKVSWYSTNLRYFCKQKFYKDKNPCFLMNYFVFIWFSIFEHLGIQFWNQKNLFFSSEILTHTTYISRLTWMISKCLYISQITTKYGKWFTFICIVFQASICSSEKLVAHQFEQSMELHMGSKSWQPSTIKDSVDDFHRLGLGFVASIFPHSLYFYSWKLENMQS